MSRNITKRGFLRSMAGTLISAASLSAAGFSLPAFAQRSGERIKRVSAIDIGAGAVVEIETESGVTGHGFTAITNIPIVVSAVRDVIAETITGQDALAHEAISEELQRLLVLRGLIAGHAMHAISAVDLALWDIKGKVLGQPVWRLLGGARSSVTAYTTFGMANMSLDELVQAARMHTAAGQTRLKMVVAANRVERQERGESLEDIMREDAERIRVVREAVGPEVELFIDANHAFNEYEARRFVRLIEAYDIALFEEPLRGNDVRRLADFRKQIAIPVSAGQNEGHIARWRDMAVNDAVDVLQMNVCMCGGYTNAVKIAAIGQAFGMQIDNGGGYALFNMHLHAGMANGGMVEWHMSSVSLERNTYRERFELTRDGKLELPDRPGLGFEIGNADVLRRLRSA